MMNSRWLRTLASILAATFAVGAISYVGWGKTPEFFGDRFWIVVLILTLIGIPLGIWLGTQEKFFT
jgi:hypothetical protein